MVRRARRQLAVGARARMRARQPDAALRRPPQLGLRSDGGLRRLEVAVHGKSFAARVGARLVGGENGNLAADAKSLERAGLLHELGRTGITVSIWDKPGRLSWTDWEKVRLAPYYTKRILAPSPILNSIGDVATLNNERLKTIRVLSAAARADAFRRGAGEVPTCHGSSGRGSRRR